MNGDDDIIADGPRPPCSPEPITDGPTLLIQKIFEQHARLNLELDEIIRTLYPIGCRVEFMRKMWDVHIWIQGTVINYKKQGGLGRTSLLIQPDRQTNAVLTRTISPDNLNELRRI